MPAKVTFIRTEPDGRQPRIRFKAEGAPWTPGDAQSAAEAAGIVHLVSLPGIIAHRYLGRAIGGADAALDAARGIGEDAAVGRYSTGGL